MKVFQQFVCFNNDLSWELMIIYWFKKKQIETVHLIWNNLAQLSPYCTTVFYPSNEFFFNQYFLGSFFQNVSDFIFVWNDTSFSEKCSLTKFNWLEFLFSSVWIVSCHDQEKFCEVDKFFNIFTMEYYLLYGKSFLKCTSSYVRSRKRIILWGQWFIRLATITLQ